MASPCHEGKPLGAGGGTIAEAVVDYVGRACAARLSPNLLRQFALFRRGWVIVAFIGATAAFCARDAAHAQQSIGSTAVAENHVTHELAGASSPLAVGDSVYLNDAVRTGADSRARLVFLDSTNLAVAPLSRVVLDRFVFEGGPSAEKVAIGLVKGVFRFTTGALDKRAYTITTPTASIGVRGTVLDVDAKSTATRVTLLQGQALVCPRRKGISFEQQAADCAKGAHCECEELGRPGQTALVKLVGRTNEANLASKPVDTASLCSNEAVCTSTPYAYASSGSGFGGAAGFGWTGPYVGLQGGYAWDGTTIYVGPWNKGFGDTGAFGGAIVGYSYQFGQVVAGLQADYDFADVKGGAYRSPFAVNARINGFGSIDARLGYAFGPALVYAIGGVAIGDLEHSITHAASNVTSGFASTQTGWDLGIGIEYAFARNLSVRVEFRKYNFGTSTYSNPSYVNWGSSSNRDNQTLDVASVGLTYTFGDIFTPAPIARY
jgi:opacity protein-like surface antigen